MKKYPKGKIVVHPLANQFLKMKENKSVLLIVIYNCKFTVIK